MPADARATIATLRASHDRLRELVGPLSAEALGQPSACADWTIAQVLSHLGSQSEIFDRMLVAARDRAEPPSQDENPAVWARWDAMGPTEQRDGALAVNATEMAHLEGLTDEQLAALHLSLFGGAFEVDVDGYVRLRHNEHAVHSWDVAVALDRAARVAPGSVALVLTGVVPLVQYMGKPQGTSVRLRVELTDPDQVQALLVDEQVRLDPWADQAVDGTLRLPAETFVRLLYGRLRDVDAVDLDAGSVTMADLRAIFPGI